MRKTALSIIFTILNTCNLLCQPHTYTDIYGIKESQLSSLLIQEDGKIITGGWNYNNHIKEYLIFRYNQDGTLDTSFGFDGIVLTGYYGREAAGNSLAIQSDGKILFAGVSCSWIFDCSLMLARYNQDGSVDNTFGTNGHIYAEPVSNENYEFPAIDIQYDGKIVTSVGMNNMLNQGIVMFRFMPDGVPDNSFGDNGKVKTNNGLLADASARSLKCRSDGKILVSGVVLSIDAIIASYNEDGSIDTSFGTSGYVFEEDYSWMSLLIQPDDKIVLGGYVIDDSWYSNFALARYNPDGTPDSSFGTNGKVMTGLASVNISGKSLLLQPDGKLVLAGYSGSTNSLADIVVARYYPNGTLDHSFGDEGIAVINPEYSRCVANSIAFLPGNKYLIGGYARSGYGLERNLAMMLNPVGEIDTSFNSNGRSVVAKDSDDLASLIALINDSLIVVAGATENTFSMVRYGLTGEEDSDFGRNGIVRIKTEGMPKAVCSQADLKTILTGNSTVSRFTVDGFQDTSFGVGGTMYLDSVSLIQSHVQADGKIIVSGYTTTPDNRYIVHKFNPDGNPDVTFGLEGSTTCGFGNYGDFVYASSIQGNGKIILAGDTKVSASLSSEADFDFALARFNPDGTMDTGFGIDGKVVTPISNTADHCNSLTIQDDGKILCTGNSGNSFVLVRYDTNGVLDQSFANNGVFITSDTIHFGNKVFLQHEEDMIMVLADSVKLIRFYPDGSIDNSFISGPLVNIENGEGLYDAVTLPFNYIALAGKGYRNDFCLMIVEPGGFNPIQEKEEHDIELHIYPNPFSSEINVTYELHQQEYISIELCDIMGRKINQLKLNDHCFPDIYNEKYSLNSQLSPGIYLFQFSTRHSKKCVKVLKQ